MIVSFCEGLSDRIKTKELKEGRVKDLFSQLGIDKGVALVNGVIADENTIVKGDDVVFIRQTPLGASAVAIVAGITLLVGAAVTGYQVYKMRKQMEKYKDALSSSSDTVTNLPYIKGANNVRALDRSIPYIIGGGRIAPYVLSDGYLSLVGSLNMSRSVSYLVGYNDLVIRQAIANGIPLINFTGDTPQEGYYSILSPGATDGGKNVYGFWNMYLLQSGIKNFPYTHDNPITKTYKIDEPGDQLLRADNINYKDLYYTLSEGAIACDINFLFRGLIKYASDGTKKSHSVVIRAYYSIDGGDTYKLFPTVSGNDIINNTPYTTKATYSFRKKKRLALPFYYNREEPTIIKITCESPEYTGGAGALEDVYVESLVTTIANADETRTKKNYAYLSPIDSDVSEKCTIASLDITTGTTAAEEAFSSFHLIVDGVAKTWNGTAWSSTKTPTRNPASWLLEVLTTDIHTQSKIEESEIDLDSFGELYEYCETEDLEVSKIMLDGEPKENVIQMLCDLCYSTLYKNADGKISVATDKPKANAIAIINTQNCFSFSNKKDMSRRIDGLRVSYTNEDSEYEQDTYEVMRPGVTKDANSRIRQITADGITRHAQIVKYARRLMAVESLRPKITTVEVGNEGTYYIPFAKVLVQHPSLKNGLGSAEIKNVIVSGDYIIGLDLYEPIQYEAADPDGFGVVIQAVDDDYCSPLAKAYTAGEGYVTEITFVDPILATADIIPHAGDILSYGYLNAGEFDTITSEMMITNLEQTDRGYRVELVDYNEAVYETGTIPEYTPNITSKIPSNAIPTGAPTPSTDGVSDAITDAQAPITLSGVPVFAERETCIAHCELDEVHYLLYQDYTAGSEAWEIVTINEDLSYTSFATGSGTMVDMCSHDDKIFLSSADGLFYVSGTDLIQVYDEALDSIQSDGGALYAVKDGQFCAFENGAYFRKIGDPTVACYYVAKVKDKIIGLSSDDHKVYFLVDGEFIEEPSLYNYRNNYIFEHNGSLIICRDGAGLYSVDVETLYTSKIFDRSGSIYSMGSFNGDIYISSPVDAGSPERKLQKIIGETTEDVAYYVQDGYEQQGLLAYKGFIFSVGNKGAYETVLTPILLGDLINIQQPAGVFTTEATSGRIFATPGGLYLTDSLGNIYKINDSFSEIIGTSDSIVWTRATYITGDASIIYGLSDVIGVYEIYESLPYGAPVPIDETVRNYGKIRVIDGKIYLTVKDGHIYVYENQALTQYTQTGIGFNAITERTGKIYSASDFQVYQMSQGTRSSIENAVSATAIQELFEYGDYIVWCPLYETGVGTLYGAYVNYVGNVNMTQNITLSIPDDFPLGVQKTIRKTTAYDGTPLIVVPPAGALFEGLDLAELYGRYSYIVLERIDAELFTIVELRDEYKYSDTIRVVRTKTTIEYNVSDTVTIPAGASYFDFTVPDTFNPSRCFVNTTASDPETHWNFTVLGASLKAVSTYDTIRVSVQNDGAEQDVTLNIRLTVYSANVVYKTIVLENGDTVITDRGDSIVIAVLNEE